MEETDGIIIDTLRRIGCDIEDEITSLAHFKTENVIEGVVKCLTCIQPDLQLNHRMPPALPARYKLCMDITKACQDVGYKGDLGYEMFLHGSHAEIRKVFLILIQKLPKANEQPIPESIDPLQQTLMEIRNEILNQLHRPWLPSFCNGPPKKCVPFQTCDLSHLSKTGSLPSMPNEKFIPSILEKHSYDLAVNKYPYKFPNNTQRARIEAQRKSTDVILSSRFSVMNHLQFQDSSVKKKVKPQLPPKPSHLGGPKTEDAPPTKEEQCQQLTASLETLEKELEIRQKELLEIEEDVANMTISIKGKEAELETEQREIDRKEKLYSLLPDAPAHLNRIEKLLESNQQKMADMEQQWLEIKQPLEDEYQHWLQKHKNSKAEQLKSQLEQTFQELRKIVEEIRRKEDLLLSLQRHLETLPSSALTRTFYTQRILSIVANVKKQNEEMYRVLEDVKSVQREINSLQGKVERTFTVTDEMIFKMAKTDETARRIYKYLVSLHSDCGDILDLVKQSGVISREIKDLEEQAETELRKNTGSKLKQMRSDLEQIRMENQLLEQQIRNNSK